MTHVVTEKCVDCRFTDCVEACPVACFYVLDKQLVIDPEDCIDCTACVPECPVEAIYMEEDLPDEHQAATAFNASEAERLKGEGQQGITDKIDALPTAEAKKTELGF